MVRIAGSGRALPKREDDAGTAAPGQLRGNALAAGAGTFAFAMAIPAESRSGRSSCAGMSFDDPLPLQFDDVREVFANCASECNVTVQDLTWNMPVQLLRQQVQIEPIPTKVKLAGDDVGALGHWRKVYSIHRVDLFAPLSSDVKTRAISFGSDGLVQRRGRA